MYLVIVLILVPTYEKVQHAYTTAREFSQDMAIEVKSICENTTYMDSHVHVLVATPDRVQHLVDKGNVDLSKCKIVVVDDADNLQLLSCT